LRASYALGMALVGFEHEFRNTCSVNLPLLSTQQLESYQQRVLACVCTGRYVYG